MFPLRLLHNLWQTNLVPHFTEVENLSKCTYTPLLKLNRRLSTSSYRTDSHTLSKPVHSWCVGAEPGEVSGGNRTQRSIVGAFFLSRVSLSLFLHLCSRLFCPLIDCYTASHTCVYADTAVHVVCTYTPAAMCTHAHIRTRTHIHAHFSSQPFHFSL